MTLNKITTAMLAIAATSGSLAISANASADALVDALKEGKTTGAFRLRYENVDQDGKPEKGDAMTLRSRLNYTSGSLSGFSFTGEFEDSRVVGGFDDYDPFPPADTDYPIIADPETTEVDQAFVQYKNDAVTAKLGRQVIALGNQRFVGHVGWRQDRQTFDGLRVSAAPIENLKLDASYVYKRNRIFAENGDIDANDLFLNADYQTPIGKISAYGYLLEAEKSAIDNSLETYGIRFAGATKGDVSISYALEFATQDNENTLFTGGAKVLNNGDSFSTDYFLAEAGVSFSGVKITAGIESLGSDDSLGAFITPLATLHKFQGWNDQFLNTPAEGLVDTYVSVGGKLAGIKLVAAYHMYEADAATDTVDDLGDEINLLAAKKFGKNYTVGLKYSAYSAGDVKADTDKMWLWTELTF